MAAPVHFSGGPTASSPLAAGTKSAAAANTYSDLSGLSALKNAPRSPQALHAVAQQIDAMFLQMMLKSMRDASADTGETPSNELSMYQDMFDKQIALTLSQHQDMGLASAILRQLGGTAAAATASADAQAAGAMPGAPGSAGAAGGPTAPLRRVTAGAMTSLGISGTGMATGGSTSAALRTTAPAASAAPEGAAPTAATALDDSTSRYDVAAAPTAAAIAAAASAPSRFVNAVLPAIRVAADVLGVSPLGMLAQAALETGWGQRMPKTASGASSLNLFGIKADDGWDGPKATATTVEISGGVAKPQRASFRVYDSIEQSVGDFANLLGNSPRYRAAIAAGTNAHAYVASIGKSGYASDPAYAVKLANLMNSHAFREAVAASGIVF